MEKSGAADERLCEGMPEEKLQAWTSNRPLQARVALAMQEWRPAIEGRPQTINQYRSTSPYCKSMDAANPPDPPPAASNASEYKAPAVTAGAEASAPPASANKDAPGKALWSLNGKSMLVPTDWHLGIRRPDDFRVDWSRTGLERWRADPSKHGQELTASRLAWEAQLAEKNAKVRPP